MYESNTLKASACQSHYSTSLDVCFGSLADYFTNITATTAIGGVKRPFASYCIDDFSGFNPECPLSPRAVIEKPRTLALLVLKSLYSESGDNKSCGDQQRNLRNN